MSTIVSNLYLSQGSKLSTHTCSTFEKYPGLHSRKPGGEEGTVANKKTFEELGLFTGISQKENFCRMNEVLETRTVSPSSSPRQWETGTPLSLPETYDFFGETRVLEEYLEAAEVAALLVVQDGKIRHEEYRLTGGVDVPWISMSVAKSVVSILVGIAVHEGHIKDIEDPISDYITVDPGSAYDGVAIRSVLQMSSGARWDEDYSNKESDALRLAKASSGEFGGHEGFVATRVREFEPDTVCRYNSGDTLALALLVRAATGESLADFMHSRLSEPLGLTSPAYWILDPHGVELGYAGLNMVARDYAAVGELYRNFGEWNGKQIVPREWVEASITADRPHLMPGSVVLDADSSENPLGYGYQWWLLPGDRGDYSAIGVYNQFIYVDPKSQTTIVMLSATTLYGTTTDPAVNRDADPFAIFHAIVSAGATTP